MSTIDGVPVHVTEVRFGGTLGTDYQFAAGEVTPMLVLVAVGPIEYVPEGGGSYRRVNCVDVTRTHVPKSKAEYDDMMAVLTGQGGEPPLSFEDGVRRRLGRPLAQEQGGAEVFPVDQVDPAALEAVMNAPGPLIGNPAADDDGEDWGDVPAAGDEEEFVLPPPPPIPEGQVTLRRIVPGDERLRNFLEVGD